MTTYTTTDRCTHGRTVASRIDNPCPGTGPGDRCSVTPAADTLTLGALRATPQVPPSPEWQAGDVALICDEFTQEWAPALYNPREGAYPCWTLAYGGQRDAGLTRARRVAVIDPEDEDLVDHLTKAIVEAAERHGNTVVSNNGIHPDTIAAAINAFLTPTPPRIPEPGLWGVVEAWVDGIPQRRWVHHEEDWWVCDTGERRRWDELQEPTLVRDGVPA